MTCVECTAIIKVNYRRKVSDSNSINYCKAHGLITKEIFEFSVIYLIFVCGRQNKIFKICCAMVDIQNSIRVYSSDCTFRINCYH